MDLEDIDSWYDDQKTKLTEEYNSKLKKTDESFKIEPVEEEKKKQAEKKINNMRDEMNKRHGELKKDYLKQMKALHKKYEEKVKDKLANNLNKHFRKHKFKMWKKKHLKFLIKEKKSKEEKKS